MSRVFAATETALGRRVVIKVLPPELAEGLSVERFKREIQLAARLQNPHIVPVLTAGEMQGLPYYTMPFVTGHSLRARLVNGGPLPITEAISILRDVARALTCAHDAGVVHRDIKPDNVLLSGGSAVVTDFGVAKALTESKKMQPGATLTHVGTSLGTPAYMAPEQAAADAAMDHRADIYAFGVMGYELLAGEPPFHGRAPQKLLLAQMSERPMPIDEIRADTPPLLAQLIMKCLEKEPHDRPQSATELVRALEQVTSGGGIPAMPAILLGGRRRLGRALLFYALAYAGVAIVARAAVIAIGLPTWVFPAAIALMALGLPIILATAFVHHGVQRAMTTAATTTGGSSTKHSTMTKLAVKAGPWLSWRRVAIGGSISLMGLALFVLVFMLMRAYGIGPAGSLLASGKLDAKDRLLVADFRASGADTSLGSVMTEAVRTDLGQSSTIALVPQSAIVGALKLMQRPDTTHLSAALAREVAQREGTGAVVDGEIRPLGSGFVLTLRLLASQSGDALATYQETIESTSSLLPAIDRLTKKLRGKIGESLKAVEASLPLEEVTTHSLEALRKYSEGTRAQDVEYDNSKAIALYRAAIAIDTEFAMAYRRLGTALYWDERPREEFDSAFSLAYRYRSRLPDRERYLAVESYYGSGPGRDRSKAADALRSVLQVDSTDPTALNDLAYLEQSRRNYPQAEALFQRLLVSARKSTDSILAFEGLVYNRVAQNKMESARVALQSARAAFPTNNQLWLTDLDLVYFTGREDSATRLLLQVRKDDPVPQNRADATFALSSVALLHGRIAEGMNLRRDAILQNQLRGVTTDSLAEALDEAFWHLWYGGDQKRGAKELDAILARVSLHSLPLSRRHYLWFASVYAIAGRPDRARTMLSTYKADVNDSAKLRDDLPRVHNALAEIALAENRPVDAHAEFALQDQRADGPTDGCAWCQLPNFGRAYDRANMVDSTIAVFERFLAAPRYLGNDDAYLAGIHKRLGELYEGKGNATQAISHYEAFINLWKNADAELQPKVAEVRRRLAHLEEQERLQK